MTQARITTVQPVLPSQDVPGAIAFYERLGFTLAFRDSAENTCYAGVRRDGVEIHLQWHDPAEWKAVERPQLRFVVPDVDELFKEYEPLGVFHDGTAVRETAWGTREFAFFDPDSNGLFFYRDLA
jgi:catechol 2,3-dioxygenase-like lactoylglutathione lyase family enzyme